MKQMTEQQLKELLEKAYASGYDAAPFGDSYLSTWHEVVEFLQDQAAQSAVKNRDESIKRLLESV